MENFSESQIAELKQLLECSWNHLIPSGTIVSYACAIKRRDNPFPHEKYNEFDPHYENVPRGWLLCDGRALLVKKPIYANLKNALLDFWGQAPDYHVRLPALEGQFLRGAVVNQVKPDHHDNDAFWIQIENKDPDLVARFSLDNDGKHLSAKQVGGFQSHIFGKHNHGGGSHAHEIMEPAKFETAKEIPGDEFKLWRNTEKGKTKYPDRPVVEEQGGNETRPINAAVNWIIKI